MDIVKKNLVSIIFGVIAILAIVAIFYPIDGMFNDPQNPKSLRSELTQSALIGTQIDQLTNTHRTKPLLSPYNETSASLDVYPTQGVIDAGVAATRKLVTESEEMMKSAVNANRHLPMSANSLPKPDEATTYKWTQDFVAQITGYQRWRGKLNAGVRPGQSEIDAAKAALHKSIMDRVVGADAATLKEAEDEYAGEALRVKAQLDMDRAKTISVYLEDNALFFDPSIGIGANHDLPTPGKIWDAQMQLWVIDDITTAIARANLQYSDPAAPGGAPVLDVLHTPVKQIVRIDDPVFVMPANPSDLKLGDTSAVPTLANVSATGHVSNALYDVYHFNVVLDVDAAKIPAILRELEINQFLTILNVQVVAGDNATSASQGFMYGTQPVARLDIQMEELMLHAWSDELMPESRKDGKTAKPMNGGQPGGYGGDDNYQNRFRSAGDRRQ